MQDGRIARTLALVSFALLPFFVCTSQSRAQFSSVTPASAFSIPQSQLIQPATLNQLLQGPGAKKLLVLQVGSHLMYAEAHIVGAHYAGPGSQAAGQELLEHTVASTPKNKFIVLYCGCCPWNHCPNVGPAYKRMRDLGFTNVKVLYLADNFGDDWVSKGYRIESGR